MKRTRRKIFLFTLVLMAIGFLLGACSLSRPNSTAAPTSAPTATLAAPTTTPEPVRASQVSPVTGMPQGTDGYPWWNDSVFYEIFVRSFYDSNGDGIGDINGLISKLDYLNDGNPVTTSDLGITGIWLMPIMPAASYHGYDVTDYFSVNPQFGTLEDFKRLMSEAHKRGIRVVIDFVLNHTSNQHPWFVASQDPQSAYRSWYIWSDTNPDPRYWHPGSHGYYYGFFTTGMPDLNYTNSEVTDKMYEVTNFWLKDVGVDGFRLDAAKYLIEDPVRENTPETHAWYQAFRKFYKSVNPNAMTVGEVWDTPVQAASYAEGDQLDLTFDFNLAQAFIVTARTGRVDAVNQALAADLHLFRPLQFASFIANHDQNRVASQLAGSMDKARAAASMLLTLPGVPFFYYGEEVGMTGIKPDEQIRTPMQWTSGPNAGFTTGTPWEAVNTNFADKRNVADQDSDPTSLLNFYRRLIALRSQHAALRVGEFIPIASDNPAVFAGLRISKEEVIMVVANISQEPVTGYHLTLDKGPLSGEYQALPILGDGPFAPPVINAQGGLDSYQPQASLPPASVLLIQLPPVK